MSNNTIAQVENLRKQYKGSIDPAVNKLSFDVYKGEILGLLGPNGAGKTTTISIMCGLLKQDEGAVRINGFDTRTQLNDIKRHIGFVGQEIALYDKLSAVENLKFFGSLYGIEKKKLAAEIDQLLERMGLYKFRNTQVGKFSGGMKRRVNLLAGLLHAPLLLFLDEPTVGVDVQSRSVIREFLSEIRAKGTTIVYSSHMMEDIQLLCDRIVIIDHGKLLIEGQPKQLIDDFENCNSLEDVFLELTGRKLRD